MIAEWINNTFLGFDYSIFAFFNMLAKNAAGILTPIAEFLAIIGDNGYFGFLIGFILLCFKKTRKCGLCVIFAIGFGALFTNLTLKSLVARPRPYADGPAVEQIKLWWEFVGAHPESKHSFPSGHTTAAMAAMTALCIAIGKKRGWIIAPAALYVLFMGASRIYLVVHYPTDVIAAIIIGGISAVIACFAIKYFWLFIEKMSQKNRFFAFLINFDIIAVFSKSKVKNVEK